MPRRRVIPVTQAALVGLLIVFWVLLGTGAAWVTVSFYFFGLILGVLLISQFWTLANDVYDARQAKRLFGFIGGGASLGGALGAAITEFLLYEVGRYNLLLFSAAALAGCIAIVTAIIARQGPSFGGEGGGIDERPISGGEALRAVAASRHLRAIALITVFAAAGAAIVKQQLSMAAEARGGDADAIGVFLASVDDLPVSGRLRRPSGTDQSDSPLVRARVCASPACPLALGSTATADPY